jgi:hypothetical protein
MKEIKLTQGKVALVSDDDYLFLSGFKWKAQKARKTFYAVRQEWAGNGKYNTVLMHREILNAHKGFQVDHKDFNGLNNQRCNIRLCSHTENLRNHNKQVNGSSRYKGVYFDKRDRLWIASLTISRKRLSLGRFKFEDDAGKAYDCAARKYFGEFARLNFIDPVEEGENG